MAGITRRELAQAGTLGSYLHTAAQLRERYHVNIGPRGYTLLCQQIVSALPDLDPTPCSQGRVMLWFPLQGRRVRFVFDVVDALVITALPPQPTPPPGGNYYTPNGQLRKSRGARRQRDHRRKYPQPWEDE